MPHFSMQVTHVTPFLACRLLDDALPDPRGGLGGFAHHLRHAFSDPPGMNMYGGVNGRGVSAAMGNAHCVS